MESSTNTAPAPPETDAAAQDVLGAWRQTDPEAAHAWAAARQHGSMQPAGGLK